MPENLIVRVVGALGALVIAGTSLVAFAGSAAATKDSQQRTLPGSIGKLTANAWRTHGDGIESGNTLKWDYQVSAAYSGSKRVQRIRATWWGGAALKNSASLDIGISESGVSVGTSSSWQYVTSKKKYWENSNGAKTSSWRSNMMVAPAKDYRSGTIYIANTALVKLAVDSRTFQITASA